MTNRIVEIILTIPKRMRYKIEEILFYRKLNWERVSKPLEEDPNDLVNIHYPTLEEYKMTYSIDGSKKTVYDWWYSAILNDDKGKLYFFILAFHPKWSFYRIIPIDSVGSHGKFESKLPIVRGDFAEEIGYSENNNAINIWIPKNRKPEFSQPSFAECDIRPYKSHLTLKADDIVVDLNFTSLGMPFWINKSREAICSPRGHMMSGFYDVCNVEGMLVHREQETKMDGVGINEHLMSFTPPERFWKRIDGVFFCTDQIYCALWYLENKVGDRQYAYKDGSVFLRATKEYLVPIDFKIEYAKIDDLKKLPVEIHISVHTTKGELTVVAQAMVETEKQLALRLLEGHFVFDDGRKLRLTNGYGQHALH